MPKSLDAKVIRFCRTAGLAATLIGLAMAGCGREPIAPAQDTESAVRVVLTQSESVRPPASWSGESSARRETLDRPTAPRVTSDVSREFATATPSLDRASSFGPRTLTLLVPERSFHRERGALRVGFDDLDLLKVLNAEPVPVDVADSLPGWLKGLDGQTVRLRGWMFPSAVEVELPQFLFVRDNEICCFGRQAKIYDKVGVYLKAGTTTSYIGGRPFDVQGRFVIKPRVDEYGEFKLLYRLVDAEVVDRR